MREDSRPSKYRIASEEAAFFLGREYRAVELDENGRYARHIGLFVLDRKIDGLPPVKDAVAGIGTAFIGASGSRLIGLEKVQQDGSWAFIKEYVPGFRLSELLYGEGPVRLNINAVLFVFRELCSALGDLYAQSADKGTFNGLIHPANVIFTENGKIRIDNYFLGTILARSSSTREDHQECYGRFLLGDEQGRARFDKRVDLIQMGCLLFEMISGRRLDRTLPASDLPSLLERTSLINAFSGEEPIPDEIRTYVLKATGVGQEGFSSYDEMSGSLGNDILDTGKYLPVEKALLKQISSYLGPRLAGLKEKLAEEKELRFPARQQEAQEAADVKAQGSGTEPLSKPAAAPRKRERKAASAVPLPGEMKEETEAPFEGPAATPPATPGDTRLIETVLQDVPNLFYQNKLDEALGLVDSGLAAASDNRDLKQMKDQIHATIERKTQVVRVHMDKKEYKAALAEIRGVLPDNPRSFGHLSSYRDEIQAYLMARFQEAQKAYDRDPVGARNIISEIQTINEDNSVSPAFEETRGWLDKVAGNGETAAGIDKEISAVNKLIENKAWKEAADKVDAVLTSDPDNKVARAFKKRIEGTRLQINQLFAESKELAQNGDYARALEKADQILDLNPSNTRASEWKQEIEAGMAEAPREGGSWFKRHLKVAIGGGVVLTACAAAFLVLGKPGKGPIKATTIAKSQVILEKQAGTDYKGLSATIDSLSLPVEQPVPLDIAPGTSTIVFQKGQHTFPLLISIKEGELTRIPIPLVTQGISIMPNGGEVLEKNEVISPDAKEHILSLLPGSYTFAFEKAGYVGQTRPLTLTKDQTPEKLRIQLKESKGTGTLVLSILPSGTAYEGDKPLATFPPAKQELVLAEGTHSIRIEGDPKDGCPGTNRKVEIVKGGKTTLKVFLCFGYLFINSEPKGAAIFIDEDETDSDGIPYGITPSTKLRVPTGYHTLTLRAGGLQKTVDITILKDQTERKSIDLTTK